MKFKLLEHLKKMDKNNRKLSILTFVIIILLAILIGLDIFHIKDYNSKVASGNARWEQVEDRILEYEHKIDLLEKDVENLQLKINKGGQ
jgi:cell division protein ZapA (FtsZ GTPase activity inhibitor)